MEIVWHVTPLDSIKDHEAAFVACLADPEAGAVDCIQHFPDSTIALIGPYGACVAMVAHLYARGVIARDAAVAVPFRAPA